MMTNLKRVFLLNGLLLFAGIAFAAKGTHVVYPSWFNNSFYDLRADLKEARDNGKSGIMVFFSMKTCSYCKAIIETTFQQADIVKRLRANYDVIGLNVLSDIEVVSTKGKTLWSKDFAVHEKAKFTPTMIFYDGSGNKQLRLIGYQSPQKFRGALDFLEGKHYTRMKLSHHLKQKKTTSKLISKKTPDINLVQSSTNNKRLLVVFESIDCKKCQQLRNMLKQPVMQKYTQQLNIVYVNKTDSSTQVTTPDGNKLSSKAWADQLGLLHSPAMVFFNKKSKEALRVDTDILIDEYGRDILVNDVAILDNLRARLQFFLEEGYKSLPQFQRWRSQESRKIKSSKR